MKRVLISLMALVVVVATAVAARGITRVEPRTLSGGDGHGLIRWDLPLIADGVAVPGGTDVSTDAATGDTITLTGSGQAEPGESEAAGGGTFVHRHADGTEVAHGVYYVIGFKRWRHLAGGNFAATGLIDGIGNGPGSSRNENEPSSGILRLKVRFIPDVGGVPQPGINGVLIINCHLPNTTVFVEEGVEVKIPSFNLDFTQTSGVTLFHLVH
jgi:hypothetical protein